MVRINTEQKRKLEIIMSRTVAEVREQLVVEENLFKIEVENRDKSEQELKQKEDKIVKKFLMIAVLSNIVILPVLFLFFPSINLFSLVLASIVSSSSLLILMMVIYDIFFSNPHPMSDFDSMHEKIDYLKKVRKLELELLISSTGAKIIQIKNDELGKEWHNMILEIDGKAKEYYVSFPRDEKGYASVEYYEFIPATTRSKR